MAGWKWEKLDIEVPYTNLGNASTYDPVRKKIVLLNATSANPADAYDMYLFDGRTFEKVCSRQPDSNFSCRLYSPSSLYWDMNLQELVTGQLCEQFPSTGYLMSWLLKEDSMLCWKPFTYGMGVNVIFDPVRMKAVFFSLNLSEIYEYDGSSVAIYSTSVSFSDYAYLTYDELSRKVIYFGYSTSAKVNLCEWDGQTFEVVNPNPPQGYDIDNYSPYSIAYYPELGGSVALYGTQGALLYKDKNWYPLIKEKTPLGGLIIYYPPNKKMYLFSLFDGVYVLRRAHTRPFERE
mgnify:CR=1 FL=1